MLCITAILDRHYFKADYDEQYFLEDDDQRAARLEDNLQQISASLAKAFKPELHGPIEFKFLDEIQVAALYSQITPELIEKERSIENSGRFNAKAGLAAGTLNAEVSTESGNQIRSNLQRVEFSLQRKAIETINFSIQTDACRYYSTAESWLLKREIDDQPLRIARMTSVIQKGDVASKEYKAAMDVNSAEYRQAANDRRKENLKGLLFVLSQYRGLVLVDGEYSIRNSGKEIVLTYSFIDKPRPIRFAVSVPTLAHLEHFGRKSFFRVFASVDEPLQKNGLVRLHALAVY